MQVYIDGENLRQRLVSVLHRQHRIHDRDDIFKFDVRRLVTLALGEDPQAIFYYTTKIRQPDFEIPDELRRKIDHIMDSHRRWIADLTNQGIRVVKGGTLKVHNSRTCYVCGKRTMLLQEKGVDVRLAIDVVQAAVSHGTDEIAILSSDADMIPALEVARRSGLKVTYLCMQGEENKVVAMAADRTVTYSEQEVLEAYRGQYQSRQLAR